MRNAPAAQTKSPDEAGATPDFHVMLLYQDFPSGLRVKEFFDGLVRDHGTRFRFLCHLWKFDLLETPGLNERALSEAVHADMLAIATRGDAELPSGIQAWLARWVRQASSPGALVGLLEGAHPGRGVHAYLSEIAAEGRMKFFCREFSASKTADLPATAAIPEADSVFIPPPGDDSPHSTALSHWGINE